MTQRFWSFIFYRVLGWNMYGAPPENLKKFLFVALPHTSNWDFIYAWMATKVLGRNVSFFVKDSFCQGPLNCVCRFVGAVPVNRRENTNFVDAMAKLIIESDEMVVLIAPEGTRSFSPKIKSGYYYLAKAANLDIIVAGPNYRDKSFMISDPRKVLKSFEEDEQNLIEFCKTQHGKRPDCSFR